MVKALLLAALVFVASARSTFAQDTKVSVGMTGIGGMSCAHWRATKEQLSEGTVWIFGFWTALNYVAAASEQPQSGTATAEIVNPGSIQTGTAAFQRCGPSVVRHYV